MSTQENVFQHRVSHIQRALFIIAIGSTVLTIAWPIGDVIYTHTFSTPGPWWVLVLVSLSAWIAWVARFGQEQIIQGQAETNLYLAGLASRLDVYGDAREAAGHRFATAVRASSNGHLHLVD